MHNADLLRAVCRRRGWEFCAGQPHYRWFGRCAGRPAAAAGPDAPPTSAAATMPSACRAAATRSASSGRTIIIARSGTTVRKAASPMPSVHAAAVSGKPASADWSPHGLPPPSARQPAPARAGATALAVTARRTGAVMHVRVARRGATALWLFDPVGPDGRLLADALGTVRIDEITRFDADPAGDPSPAVHS